MRTQWVCPVNPIKELATYPFPSQKNIIAVLGPSGSGKLQAVSKLFEERGAQVVLKDYQYLEEASNPALVKRVGPFSMALNLSLHQENKNIVFVFRNLPQPRPGLAQQLREYCERRTSKSLIVFCLNSTIYRRHQVETILGLRTAYIVYIKEYSESNLRAHLRLLLQEHRLSLSKTRQKELVEGCRGDLRVLRNCLQVGLSDKDRDHGVYRLVGKFLYNKRVDRSGQVRQPSFRQYKEGQLGFYFDPKEKLEEYPELATQFSGLIHQNMLHFFTEEGELATFYEMLCEHDCQGRPAFAEAQAQKQDFTLLRNWLVGVGYMLTNLHVHERKHVFKEICFSKYWQFAAQIKENNSFIKEEYPTLKAIDIITARPLLRFSLQRCRVGNDRLQEGPSVEEQQSSQNERSRRQGRGFKDFMPEPRQVPLFRK